MVISGTEQSPNFTGQGPVIEYAIKMIEFPQEALFDYLLANQKIPVAIIELLGKKIAAFHQQAKIVDGNSRFGTPEQVFAPVSQNFTQIRPLLKDKKDLDQLAQLETLATQQYQTLKPVLQARKDQGFIRECHGDLHLKNIVLLHNQPVIFDCIEFNEDFRWTDTLADAGFLAMDFADNKRADYAHRFINTYMAYSGDYSGLTLLRFYMAYRAMVRAKVALFRLTQPDLSSEEQSATVNKYRSCTQLVEAMMHSSKSALIIMHGYSGSGKSSWAKQIVDQYGAIQIRSDIERKRLFNLAPESASHSALNAHIYSPEATEKTAAHIESLTKNVLTAGYLVIIDATFIKKNQRIRAQQMAKELKVPFVIVECQAPYETLKRHIVERQEYKSDPSEARLEVLEWQQTEMEALSPEERQHTVTIDITKSPDPKTVFQQLDALL